MLERFFMGAVVMSALACGGSSANSAPESASSESAAGGPAAPAEAAPVEGAPGEGASPDAAASEAVAAATSAADSWLKLVDEAQYDASWANAAGVFKGAVTSEAWASAVGGVRGQVGKLVSRKLASASYTTQVPNAPPGKYVIIQYDTDFDKKASSVETVTPMQDPDGQWRVAGYFVR